MNIIMMKSTTKRSPIYSKEGMKMLFMLSVKFWYLVIVGIICTLLLPVALIIDFVCPDFLIRIKKFKIKMKKRFEKYLKN